MVSLLPTNRISWNLVDSKDTICSCAYYQEILIFWILWELCLFELRNFPKFTTEAACQHNSSETIEQNFMKLGKSYFRSIFRKILSSKGHNSHKIQGIKISWEYAQLNMVSLLPTKFHEILFSSFRGVVLTSCFRSIFGEIFKFKGA
jgi:hypothetical protein